MAILGNNTAGGNYETGGVGRMLVSKFTLAAAATLNELHAWVAFGTAGNTIRIVIYKHLSGTNPDGATRVAYTNPITLSGSGTDTNVSQAGFSVALPAADYWIGVRFNTDGYLKGSSGGGYRGISSGTPDPPPDPFGASDSGGGDTLSAWAVVGAALTPPAADFTGTPLTGTRPLSVAFTDSSTNTPTSWAWTFGDSGTSTAQNPTHSYTTAGTYTVALTATNSSGSDTKTRAGYVTVGNPSGTLTKIEWGDRLVVTDLGSGVIRVDFV